MNANDGASAVSVRDLVQKRMDATNDPWNLALVQRDEVWDHVRMRHLLDSLLLGYPVGSLLLCSVEAESVTITADGSRARLTAGAREWQLVDGQQRVNALVSMFTAEGRYGRFYLDMITPKPPRGPLSRRSSKDRELAYIAHRDAPDDGLAPWLDRGHHIDLARWYAWAESERGQQAKRELLDSSHRGGDIVEVLREIDDEFAFVPDPSQREIAHERLIQLLRAWHETAIPVLRARVRDALDILEVFTRLNMGGVPVVGADVYFAAVKTLWPDAEAALRRVDGASPFIAGRFGALRLVSRLASWALAQEDLIPLSVDRLVGDRGGPLLQAMKLIAAPGSVVLDRIAQFSHEFSTESGIGYALRDLTPELWDSVLGWAAASDPEDRNAWLIENVPLIDSFLLGATVFRYSSILGRRFHRAALREALLAGSQQRAFPLDQILGVAHAGGLVASGQWVRTLTDKDREWLAAWNPVILLSVAQRVPYGAQDLDVDHIFAANLASKMWAPGNGRRRHHRDRQLINWAGNYWLLHASTNRAIQDTPPQIKFGNLTAWLERGDEWHPVWPREQWFIEPAEVASFVEVYNLLDEGSEQTVEQGMQLFRQVVLTRQARLLGLVLDRFPAIAGFASDPDAAKSDPTPKQDISMSLGLEMPTLPVAPTVTVLDGEVDPDELLELGPDWTGRYELLASAIKEASRRFLSDIGLTTHSLPFRDNSGFDRGRFIRLGTPDPNTYMGVGIVSTFADETPVWLQVDDGTEGFAEVRSRLQTSPFEPSRRSDGKTQKLWYPVTVPSNVAWPELVQHLLGQLQEFRRAIVTG